MPATLCMHVEAQTSKPGLHKAGHQKQMQKPWATLLRANLCCMTYADAVLDNEAGER